VVFGEYGGAVVGEGYYWPVLGMMDEADVVGEELQQRRGI
jgi:hypothetical protein